MESWKDIPGSNGWYQVSSHGRVRSYKFRGPCGMARKDPVILSARQDGAGYPVTCLRRCGGRTLVHRLVAAAFIGPRPPGMQVDHIDGNKLNNHYQNLRYVTRSENMGNVNTKESQAKRTLTEETAKSIWEDGQSTQLELARKHSVSPAMVWQIKNGGAWNNVTQLPSRRRKTSEYSLV